MGGVAATVGLCYQLALVVVLITKAATIGEGLLGGASFVIALDMSTITVSISNAFDLPRSVISQFG